MSTSKKQLGIGIKERWRMSLPLSMRMTLARSHPATVAMQRNDAAHSANELPDIHGYRANDHEFANQAGVFESDFTPMQ